MRLCLVALFFHVAACTLGPRTPPPEALPDGYYESYSASIQPILNRRCAVCHSCNDAPCQLDQTAFAGVDRGAIDADVYADRLFRAEPTRLFIDASSTEQWRRKGFFPVIQHYPAGDLRNLEASVLYQLIAYRKFNPLPRVQLDARSSRSCPNLETPIRKLTGEIASLFDVTPHADLGMPYGLPPLSDEDFNTLRKWLIDGAPGPNTEPRYMREVERQRNAIERWERMFNDPSPKHRLVARYLYEHLFYAHLHLDPDRSFEFSSAENTPIFFRLVRSRTPSPEPIEEIARRLPTDDAGPGAFFYRLRPIESTIVHKTHLVFELNAKRLARIEKAFFGDDWTLSENEIPGYDAADVNPFQIFRKIPAEARYRFMLENAEYFVGSFMKGPVCRGQIALNVIDDHFFIFFLDPDADQSVQNPAFLQRTERSLLVPFRPEDHFGSTSGLGPGELLKFPIRALQQLRRTFYPFYKKRQLRYLKLRDEFYQRARPRGYSLEDIWDGERWDSNAVLTVFRHHDSASVTRGAVGRSPRSVLVLDYPIFERMYYNLVASFDIFGDIKLQLAARLYMDDLRIEGEDLFLSFLPLDVRKAVRRSWYRGAEEEIEGANYPFYGTLQGKPRGTTIEFSETGSPKDELVGKILTQRLSRMVRGKGDTLNLASGAFQGGVGPITSESTLDHELSRIGGSTGPFVAPLPDLIFVRVRRGAKPRADDLVYTFVHNRDHLNVKYLFSESARLNPSGDSLTIVKGFQGSYPNFYFDVELDQAQSFLAELTTVRFGDGSWDALAKRFGITKTDERFWSITDWFNDRFVAADPVASGLFDLARYH